MPTIASLTSLFTDQAVQHNWVTDIALTGSTIIISLEPHVGERCVRPDCQQPVRVQPHDRDIITVQGLGVQGRALRYRVLCAGSRIPTMLASLSRLRCVCPAFAPICLTDEAVEKALYFIIGLQPVVASHGDDVTRVQLWN